MELEQLKADWNKHNSYLENQHKINEELLKKINLDSSRRELSLPYKAEIAALIVLVICTLFFLPRVYQLWDNTYYFLSGISGLILTIGGAIIASIKIRSFASIDLYGSSLVQLQEDLSELKSTVYKLRKFELSGMPLVILFIPAAVKIVHNRDFFDLNLVALGILLVVCFIIMIPAMLWMYKKLYGERIDRARHRLREIEKYQNEVE